MTYNVDSLLSVSPQSSHEDLPVIDLTSIDPEPSLSTWEYEEVLDIMIMLSVVSFYYYLFHSGKNLEMNRTGPFKSHLR